MNDALWPQLPLPGIILNDEDHILDATAAAEGFLNRSRKNLLGQSFWKFCQKDSDLNLAFEMARSGQGNIILNDVTLPFAQGVKTGLTIHIALMGDPKNDLMVLITPAAVADTGMGAKSPKVMARSAIGMADMLAHEIKNPLAGIIGAAQLLSMNLDANDQEMTDLIVAESKRIEKLIDQVEQFGDITAPQTNAQNIHDVLDRAIQSLSLGIGRDVDFLRVYDPSLPMVAGDGDQLVQVFLNLIKNACEAPIVPAPVTVRTFYEAGLRLTGDGKPSQNLPIHVEVIDEGPGVPSDIAAHIFEPFVTSKSNGKGLGLALTSKLIAQNNGWIGVTRDAGKTVFRVSLPHYKEGST